MNDDKITNDLILLLYKNETELSKQTLIKEEKKK